MAQDRQFLVEALDAQGAPVARFVVSGPNIVSSRITSATAGAAASLVTWAGNGQSAVAGATVIPPAVRVLDANGIGVAGSAVTWEGNTISSATQQGLTGTTDANGVATLGGWSVGTTAGSASTVFAYSGNLTNSPIRFSITPTAASAFSVGVSAGNSQSSTPVSLLASRLTALVQDRYGNNVTGASVDWTSSSGDAVIGTTPGTTNSSGLVGTTYTTGQSASTESVWAAISSATSARFGVGVYAAPPTTVDIVSGDNQTALSGATLAQPLVVFVGDGFNNPWSSGQTVQFVVVGGSGNVSSATSTPDANGLVSVTWKMGATAGTNRLEVSLANISGSTVTFTASGTNPVADTIQIESGNSQTGTAGSALALPLAVATLGSGSSASGQLVTFSATSGSLSTSAIVSSTSGIARTVWTLPTGAGTYTVTASAGTLAGSPLVFSAIANAGTATQLVLATQPSSQPEIGVAWPQQPVVVSTDQYGNPVSTNTRVGAVLASGDGVLASAVSTYAIASGATATFSGLSYTYVSSPNFQLEFEARSLSTATATAQVSQPPFASQLAFTTQPAGGAVGTPIGTVVVTVQDSLGQKVTNATNSVTVSLTPANNTEGATLSGTATAAASGGDATFTGLSVNLAGSYTLSAAATNLTGVTSSAFNVTGTSHPNEPAGFTQRTARQFNAVIEDGWTSTSIARLSIVADATAPRSPSNVAACLYPAGFAGGRGPIWTQKYISPVKEETYIHWFFKMDSNWSGHQGSVNKMLWVGLNNGAENQYVFEAYGAGMNTLKFALFGQGMPIGQNTEGVSNGNAWNSGVGNDAPIVVRGQWHNVEAYIKLNSANGVKDGVFKLWFDGTLVRNFTAMCWRGTNADGSASGIPITAKISTLKWNPTYGGIGGTVLYDQYMYFDDFYWSTP